MNLRDNKTYIDELFGRVQDGYLNPDEASTLLWGILDSFNRAWLASQDSYQNGPWATHLEPRRPPTLKVHDSFSGTAEQLTGERTVWSASGEMIASDGTRTPINNITLRMRMPSPLADQLRGLLPQFTGQAGVNAAASMEATQRAVQDLGSDYFKPKCSTCQAPVTWSSPHSKWEHVDAKLDLSHLVGSEATSDEPLSWPVKGRVPNPTLYCQQCRGAVTFENVSEGIGRWVHLNPGLTEDHRVELSETWLNKDETCIKCQQPIFYGALPNGEVGWVHYGPAEPEHRAVQLIRTGDDPEPTGIISAAGIRAAEASTDLRPLTDNLTDPAATEPPEDVEMDEPVDVLAGEDPEEGNTNELRRLDMPRTLTGYSLWNKQNPTSAGDIHKTHKDGQSEQA